MAPPRARVQFTPSVNQFFALAWTGLWLYLSLGLVIVSFGAIEFQAYIIEEAYKIGKEAEQHPLAAPVQNGPDASAPVQAVKINVTMATIEVENLHYGDFRKKLEEDERRLVELGKTSRGSDSDAQTTSAENIGPLQITTITQKLFSKLYPNGNAPTSDIIPDMNKRCAEDKLDAEASSLCTQFKQALDHPTVASTVPTGVDAKLNDLAQEIVGLKKSIADYELSPSYSLYDELQAYKNLAAWVTPWWTAAVPLPSLPHQTLVLVVTLAMGALGSVLFMLHVHLGQVQANSFFRSSVTWHVFRPLQGMALALAIFMLVKAGQISISHTGIEQSTDSTDINAFALGFVGIVAGMLSDSAMLRLQKAGVDFLGQTDAQDDGGDSKARSAAPDSATLASAIHAALEAHGAPMSAAELVAVLSPQGFTLEGVEGEKIVENAVAEKGGAIGIIRNTQNKFEFARPNS